MNLFLNADCMNPDNGMPSYPDKYFELAIVDPPYGIGDRLVDGGGTNSMIKWQDDYYRTRWDEAPTQEYFNELFRISANQIVCGGNYFTLPPSRGIVCWDKVQFVPSMSSWEYIWTSFDCPAKKYEHRNMYPERIHPTQKPIALYKWLLTKYAKPNDKILDTHVGSASSLIAFEDMGFSYVGYEIDTDYYLAAQKRLENFRKQLKLSL